MSAFESLIEAVLPKFGGTKAGLAKALEMTPSGFGRGMANNSFSTHNLLTFAKVTGLDPLVVLRAAGKTDVADLIEQLFGKSAAGLPLSRPERDHLADWNALSPKDRATFEPAIKALADMKRESSRASSKESPVPAAVSRPVVGKHR